MNKLQALNDSKLISLALVLMAVVLGISVFTAGTADPWWPYPWP